MRKITTKRPGSAMLAFLRRFPRSDALDFEDLARDDAPSGVRSLIRRALLAGWIDGKQGGEDGRCKTWRLTKKGVKVLTEAAK